MKIIIKGEKTVREDTPALCTTCGCALIIKGSRPSEMQVLCQAVFGAEPLNITWHVTDCTSYQDKTIVSLTHMEKIAYRFSVDDRKKTMGFRTPEQWKAAHPDGGPGDDYSVD